MVLKLDDLIDAAREAEERRELERQLTEAGIDLPSDLVEPTPREVHPR